MKDQKSGGNSTEKFSADEELVENGTKKGKKKTIGVIGGGGRAGVGGEDGGGCWVSAGEGGRGTREKVGFQTGNELRGNKC